MRHLRALLLPALVVLVWDLASRTGHLLPQEMPSPETVAATGMDFLFGDPHAPGAYAFSGQFLHHAGMSLLRVVEGFLLATAVGVPLGLALGMSPWLSAFCSPLLQVLRPIPVTAWLPLAIVWFGLGHRATVYLIFIGAVFPILVNATAGVRSMDQRHVEAARMLGARPHQLFARVYLPGALPSILTGLRVGLGFAWVCVVVGEMTGVGFGLGAAIADARELFRVDLIVVGMLLIGGIGFLSDKLLVIGLRRLVPWAPQLFR